MASSPDTIFGDAHKAGASDVHIAVGSPAIFRIDGKLEEQGKSKLTLTDV
jgi:Tfp pilus assembly pilus retraction ATPase PilT